MGKVAQLRQGFAVAVGNAADNAGFAAASFKANIDVLRQNAVPVFKKELEKALRNFERLEARYHIVELGAPKAFDMALQTYRVSNDKKAKRSAYAAMLGIAHLAKFSEVHMGTPPLDISGLNQADKGEGKIATILKASLAVHHQVQSAVLPPSSTTRPPSP